MVLKLRIPPPNNWKDAKCAKIVGRQLSQTYDPFFGLEIDAEGNELDEEEPKNHALAFCNGEFDGIICPIRHECLLFALTNNAKEGIWGGTDEVTRKAIRKKFPPEKIGKANNNWRWMSQQEALEGLSRKKVQEELQQEILEEE